MSCPISEKEANGLIVVRVPRPATTTRLLCSVRCPVQLRVASIRTHIVSVSMTEPLSLRGAHFINAVLTLGYVLPLYFTKYTRLSFSKSLERNDRSPSKGASERPRDDPAVIKARLLSVFVSTMASLCLVQSVVAANQCTSLDVSSPSSHAFVNHISYHSMSVQQLPTLGFLFAGMVLVLTL
jgi:hypothetical protein